MVSYYEEPDKSGHTYGPDSAQVRDRKTETKRERQRERDRERRER